MDLIEGRGGNLFHSYRRRFFENLKNATPLWLLLLAASFFLYADCRIIVSGTISLPRIALIPLLATALLTGAVSAYVFPLTARYQFTTKDALRNAAILAVACLPRTILMLLAGAVIPWLFWNVTRLLPLFFVLGISLPCYLQALLYLPVFEIIKTKNKDKRGTGHHTGRGSRLRQGVNALRIAPLPAYLPQNICTSVRAGTPIRAATTNRKAVCDRTFTVLQRRS